jgi:hypothetical protein
MSFSDEVRIISRVAWTIAVLGAAGLFVGLVFAMTYDAEMRQWPLVGQAAFCLGVPLFVMAAILLIGYINADARRRGMRYVMWTLLALFLPNSLGIILYFVLRDPILKPCPKCGAPSGPNFTYCPQCGAELAPGCPTCKRAVDPLWKRCAYCGVALANSK